MLKHSEWVAAFSRIDITYMFRQECFASQSHVLTLCLMLMRVQAEEEVGE